MTLHKYGIMIMDDDGILHNRSFPTLIPALAPVAVPVAAVALAAVAVPVPGTVAVALHLGIVPWHGHGTTRKSMTCLYDC